MYLANTPSYKHTRKKFLLFVVFFLTLLSHDGLYQYCFFKSFRSWHPFILKIHKHGEGTEDNSWGVLFQTKLPSIHKDGSVDYDFDVRVPI